ncbi:protein PET117 homolog, mitochondrial [Leptopilina heterotoma]|uniref:protein PET117 homolog, mitochondrial n=1 Tax=Leptopilina heterotoma TaxID=63436 RepID=UPI001CA9EF3E|nr:protein PET117 homolog, mitochondrial [Leptopilina heterotoma]
MSLASKTVFTLSCVATVSTIAYVHYKQQFDQEQLRLGVIRDKENQDRRKRENLHILNKQQALAEELRRSEAEKDKLTNLAL